MSCHDAVDGSQAEAGAFAGAFGCEKWLEKMLACTLVHPTAVVAHGEEYAGKGWSTCLRESRSRDALKFTVAGFDDNAAAVRQGISGVEDQIQNDLLGLRVLDLEQAQIGVELEFERDVLSEQARKKIFHVLGHLIETERAELGFLWPGKN
jgi:hypothetical protein